MVISPPTALSSSTITPRPACHPGYHRRRYCLRNIDPPVADTSFLLSRNRSDGEHGRAVRALSLNSRPALLAPCRSRRPLLSNGRRRITGFNRTVRFLLRSILRDIASRNELKTAKRTEIGLILKTFAACNIILPTGSRWVLPRPRSQLGRRKDRSGRISGYLRKRRLSTAREPGILGRSPKMGAIPHFHLVHTYVLAHLCSRRPFLFGLGGGVHGAC